jgi:hypothetical protein
MTVSDFTAARMYRKRMNPIYALTVAKDVAVLFHLQKQRSAFLSLIGTIVDSFDEEDTSIAVEFDFSIYELRSCNLNRTTSSFFRDHVNRFLRERMPEQ